MTGAVSQSQDEDMTAIVSSTENPKKGQGRISPGKLQSRSHVDHFSREEGDVLMMTSISSCDDR